MKKNSISKLEILQSNDCGHRDYQSVNIPVIVLIGLSLLAINIFVNRSINSPQNPGYAFRDDSGQFISITGAPNTADGVYFLTEKQLKDTFPELAPLVLRTSSTSDGFTDVSAVQYKAGLPGKTALPAELANIFFLPIPINRAGRDVISSLPGIGPVLAERIIERRNSAGPFRSKNELLQISGIGPKKFAGLSDHIYID